MTGIRSQIEPAALRYGTLASREGYADESEIRYSIAISLKRIADALESTIDHCYDQPAFRMRKG